MPTVRHWASVSQAASPISTATSRIRLALLGRLAPFSGEGTGLAFVEALNVGPDMLAPGGWMGGCAEVGTPAVSALKGATQADRNAALINPAHSSFKWLGLLTDRAGTGDVRIGVVRVSEVQRGEVLGGFFISQCSLMPGQSAN